ncbi:MAG: hypothetical protein QXK12_06180 [Candidatus Nezhaarchaeales archaeon]
MNKIGTVKIGENPKSFLYSQISKKDLGIAIDSGRAYSICLDLPPKLVTGIGLAA